jgi:hypothetical protein
MITVKLVEVEALPKVTASTLFSSDWVEHRLLTVCILVTGLPRVRKV